MVDKAGVEVHIGGHPLVHLPLPGDDLGPQPLHHGVQGILLVAPLFLGELLHEGPQQVGPGVRQGVDGVAHAVDESRPVEGPLVQQVLQVASHLVLVLPVPNGALHVLKHLDDLDVGPPVARALEGGQGGGHAGIGVGGRGGDHMGGEGGVVAPAVVSVEDQADVQHMGLPEGVGGIGPEQSEDVLRGGQLLTGGMDV